MTYEDYLQHWGILGQKWGKRNGPPYPLSSSQMSRAEKRMNKKDAKWARKNYEKIYKKTYKVSSKEAESLFKEALAKSETPIQVYGADGKLTKAYINLYNRSLAEVMNSRVSEWVSPSGKVVKFVAKRGEIGVHMALADRDYDLSQLKNGVFGSGKIAYRKKVVDKV